jgi:hypothetical protein
MEQYVATFEKERDGCSASDWVSVGYPYFFALLNKQPKEATMTVHSFVDDGMIPSTSRRDEEGNQEVLVPVHRQHRRQRHRAPAMDGQRDSTRLPPADVKNC